MKQYHIISISSNKLIWPYIKDKPWFINATKERVYNELLLLEEAMKQFDIRHNDIIHKINILEVKSKKYITETQPHLVVNPKHHFKQELQDCVDELSKAYFTLKRQGYRNYLPTEQVCSLLDEEFEAIRIEFVKRFEKITIDWESLIKKINSIIVKY